MQQRSKWKVDNDEVRVGALVIVKEDCSSPVQWPIGLITATHPSTDGKVRVATVRMKMGTGGEKSHSNTIKIKEFCRPITKLILLPREN